MGELPTPHTKLAANVSTGKHFLLSPHKTGAPTNWIVLQNLQSFAVLKPLRNLRAIFLRFGTACA